MGVTRRNQGADPAQIEALYREHLADFRRVAAAIVGDVERGSDPVQEAFGNALRKRAVAVAALPERRIEVVAGPGSGFGGFSMGL
jgi:DNA-directed RNA polymerase specialized sigma24 family protein